MFPASPDPAGSTNHRPVPAVLSLGVPGFTWTDLHDAGRLQDLAQAFDAFLARRIDAETATAWQQYRTAAARTMTPERVSETIVKVAPHVAAFVAQLFGIERDRAALLERSARESVIFTFKREFVKKRVARRTPAEIAALDAAARTALDADARTVLSLVSGHAEDRWNDEREVAETVMRLVEREDLFRKTLSAGGAEASGSERAEAAALHGRLKDVPALQARLDPSVVVPVGGALTDEASARLYGAVLELIERWCALRLHGPTLGHHWVSLRLPEPMDPKQLVPLRRPDRAVPERIVGEAASLRARDGFKLTDPRPSARQVRDNADYCLYCHDRNKDSCSKGFLDKSTRAPRTNALGIPLAGCPLEEKISEMNYLRNAGDSLAALAVAMVDNPMLPGTGHRICNDCMKACVYQKQTPVDIPSIETGVLTDVLAMPWGVEVYDLLTRWNPLRAQRPVARPYIGKNVLVVGMGPAGYTLAMHLLNEGFGVVGVDGLKIEPLPDAWRYGPIASWQGITRALDERVLLGFGGVSEYGITVRWDKNFLGLIYLVLARRKQFAVHGGVRFGGTLDVQDAWKLGFDHVALAAGAGRPTLVEMPNGLARGIRQASDFLMQLQLTGAYKRASMANLLVRLPGVVIGGGLTGIDTATEMRAYYVVQCEKLLARHEVLLREVGEESVWRGYRADEREVMQELLSHGLEIRAERARARSEGRVPDFNALLDRWGGVTLAYRRSLEESPAYRLNHEEVEKFLEEGVRFLERCSPREARVDEHGAVQSLVFDRMTEKDGKLVPSGETLEVAARTVCIAAGTQPNVTCEREAPGTFEMDPRTRAFRAHRAHVGQDGRVALEPDPRGFFTSYTQDGRTVSFYGDNHPAYAGSVVRAMASAKDGYPHVAALFEAHVAGLDPSLQSARDAAWQTFAASLDAALTARVESVRRLTPTIVEVTVHAPLAARRFRPGQFYRLQNYESLARVVDHTLLTMEGLALTGASSDPETGTLSMIVLEMGASSRLCATLRPGERVVLMGPTGAPTEIPSNEDVILCGGGLGNAVLFSIGRALRANGCRVVYFAGYKHPSDVYKREEIEASADQIVWATDVAPAPEPRRPQDRSFVGNIVQAMVAYARGDLGERLVELRSARRIVAIGSDRMMAAVKRARRDALAPYLDPGHVAIGSINSPMQCMMKEICAQCLQRHVDPVSGKATVVFSCFNQDQELDRVDFDFLDSRLRQSAPQERQANLWLDHLFRTDDVPRV